MKNYQLNTSTLDSFPAISKQAKGETKHNFYFGFDAELAGCAASLIVDGTTPKYLGKHERETLVALVAELVGLGHTVCTAQEACGFGYLFHEQLEDAGAASVVVAPEQLNGNRKTDKADSGKLATDIFSYKGLGNRKALRPVRVPKIDEQRWRSLHRERGQLLGVRNQLAAHGRSLAVDHNRRDAPKGWWGPKKWEKWSTELGDEGDEWLVGRLALKLELIRSLNIQIGEIERLIEETYYLRQAAEGAETSREELLATQPKGLGVPTRLGLAAEVGDWSRFSGRGQVGSYTGLCPSEHSSGEGQRLGSIDRRGNARLRTMLVEAAWRMVRFQPEWRGMKKFGQVLEKKSKASRPARRKAIVALARLLAVDLWRLETGRCSLQDLGFTPSLS